MSQEDDMYKDETRVNRYKRPPNYYRGATITTSSLLEHERKGLIGLMQVNTTGKLTEENTNCGMFAAVIRQFMTDSTQGIDFMVLSQAHVLFNTYLFRCCPMSTKPKYFTYDILFVKVAACLQLASAFFDLCPFSYANIYQEDEEHSDKISTKILDEQHKIFISMGFNVNIPNLFSYFTQVNTKNLLDGSWYTVAVCMMYYISVYGSNYLPSVLASAIVWSIKIHTKDKFENVFNVPISAIHACMVEFIHSPKYYEDMLPENISGIVDNIYKDVRVKISKRKKIVDVTEYTINHYFIKEATHTLLKVSDLDNHLTIGKGSFGVVRLIDVDNIKYAVKTSSSDLVGHMNYSFVRECSLLQSLDHINIVKQKYFVDDICSIVLELAPYDLNSSISRNGPLNMRDQVRAAAQLFRALTYIHSNGIIHRDIKPSNILVFHVNNNFVLKITDFGSGRGGQITYPSSKFTTFITTVQYRSPEIIDTPGKYSSAVDVWSMCCTLYEIATGSILFNKTNEYQLLFDILVTLGMNKEPENKNVFDNYLLSPLYKKIMRKGLVYWQNKRATAREMLLEISSLS